MDMRCFTEGHLSSLLQCLEFKILCRNARVLLPWWNTERTRSSWRTPDMTPEPQSAAQHLYVGDAFLAANIISWAITSVSDLPAMITRPTFGMFGLTLSLLCLDGGPSATCSVAAAGF
ncbi:uncharacterized protein LOC144114301 [Amblyomma americanum]